MVCSIVLFVFFSPLSPNNTKTCLHNTQRFAACVAHSSTTHLSWSRHPQKRQTTKKQKATHKYFNISWKPAVPHSIPKSSFPATQTAAANIPTSRKCQDFVSWLSFIMTGSRAAATFFNNTDMRLCRCLGLDMLQ